MAEDAPSARPSANTNHSSFRLLAVSLNHSGLLKSMGPDPKHLGFNGPDYRTLYSLLDWMESEGWTEKQIAAVTDQDADAVKAFTGTANNATILDPLARHEIGRAHVCTPVTK